VHEANDFNLYPIREVAILFAGIFATMMPALDWLQLNAVHLGQPTPSSCFFGSGALSSVLDNAPTYLSFLSAAFGAFTAPPDAAAIMAYLNAHGSGVSGVAAQAPTEQVGQAVAVLCQYYPRLLASGGITHDQAQMAILLGNPFYAKCLQAISIGSVFFGANTYIGNGPNFMVKAIADQQNAHTPSFLGYFFKFTLPFMAPTLLIVWAAFFR
jgi:Na+/H+ antiporter NhaD/arsenite permease-like protein